MIMAGEVALDGVVVDKPGKQIPTSSLVSLKPRHSRFASRGGLKLEAALDQFPVDVNDRVLMDVGASMGGFTDCLLKHGARRVIAIDVGYGQLAWGLRQDPRVTVLEKTNIRHITREEIAESVSGAVIDVSFISLRLVIPSVSALLDENAFIIALIKPQFEVGKGQVGKGGVVRDPLKHQEVIERISAFARSQEWKVEGWFPSPILGPKGNREFLICLIR
jgi:23S rRNA (cytidine1920-2'-O)/16S rRNA (cytidine1409-2'-O)-methyltransferase